MIVDDTSANDTPDGNEDITDDNYDDNHDSMLIMMMMMIAIKMLMMIMAIRNSRQSILENLKLVGNPSFWHLLMYRCIVTAVARLEYYQPIMLL